MTAHFHYFGVGESAAGELIDQVAEHGRRDAAAVVFGNAVHAHAAERDRERMHVTDVYEDCALAAGGAMQRNGCLVAV
jgi:hypothetical protein